MLNKGCLWGGLSAAWQGDGAAADLLDVGLQHSLSLLIADSAELQAARVQAGQLAIVAWI